MEDTVNIIIKKIESRLFNNNLIVNNGLKIIRVTNFSNVNHSNKLNSLKMEAKIYNTNIIIQIYKNDLNEIEIQLKGIDKFININDLKKLIDILEIFKSDVINLFEKR